MKVKFDRKLNIEVTAYSVMNQCILTVYFTKCVNMPFIAQQLSNIMHPNVNKHFCYLIYSDNSEYKSQDIIKTPGNLSWEHD